MKKYICEFIGTFFLVFTIGNCVIAPGAGILAPLAIGSMLMAMIFATGHISGAHLNPAVTLAVWMRGKCDSGDVPGYILGQLLGALVAAFMVSFMKGSEAMPNGMANEIVRVGPALAAEFFGAFAIAFVVLNVATAKANSNNSFYGLAIGFTVVACAFALGNYAGGAFNPAVAVGITTMGLVSLKSLWIYVVANLAGGAAAALVFKAVSNEPVQKDVVSPPNGEA